MIIQKDQLCFDAFYIRGTTEGIPMKLAFGTAFSSNFLPNLALGYINTSQSFWISDSRI